MSQKIHFFSSRKWIYQIIFFLLFFSLAFLMLFLPSLEICSTKSGLFFAAFVFVSGILCTWQFPKISWKTHTIVWIGLWLLIGVMIGFFFGMMENEGFWGAIAGIFLGTILATWSWKSIENLSEYTLSKIASAITTGFWGSIFWGAIFGCIALVQEGVNDDAAGITFCGWIFGWILGIFSGAKEVSAKTWICKTCAKKNRLPEDMPPENAHCEWCHQNMIHAFHDEESSIVPEVTLSIKEKKGCASRRSQIKAFFRLLANYIRDSILFGVLCCFTGAVLGFIQGILQYIFIGYSVLIVQNIYLGVISGILLYSTLGTLFVCFRSFRQEIMDSHSENILSEHNSCRDGAPSVTAWPRPGRKST